MTYTLIDAPISRRSTLREVDAWISKLQTRVKRTPTDQGLQFALESAKRIRKDVAKVSTGRADAKRRGSAG